MSSNTRAQGLGSLLATPAPEATEEEDFAAHQARKAASAKKATSPAKAKQQPPAGRRARTRTTTGALATRGAGAVLPRERTKRIAKEKLTVNLPAALIDALTELVERDDTRRYDEVEEALRDLFAKKGIDIEEE